MKEQILTENGSLHAIRLVMSCDVKIQQFEALNTITCIIYTTLIFDQYWSILINTLLQNALSLERPFFNCFSFLLISMIATCHLKTPWKFPFVSLSILNCRERIASSACDLSTSILHKTTTVQKVCVWFRHQYQLPSPHKNLQNQWKTRQLDF